MPLRSPLPSRPSLQDRQYLSYRFSGQSLTRKFLAWLVLDVRGMRKLEAHVLRGDDEVLMAFRSGRMGGLGRLGAASALVAALGASTLKTTSLSLSTAPIARALITNALILSLLATILAVILQQILTALSSPGSMRMWLGNGDTPTHHHRNNPAPKPSNDPTPNTDHNRTLKMSVASILLLRLPNALLVCAGSLYALGFGSFLTLSWILPRPVPHPPQTHNPSIAIMLLYTLIGTPPLIGIAALLRRKMHEIHRAERAGRRVATARARSGGSAASTTRPGDIEAPPTRSIDEVNEIEAAAMAAKSQGGAGGARKRERDRDRDRDRDSDRGKDALGPKGAGGGMGMQPVFTQDEVLYHEDTAGALEQAAKAHRDLAELIKDAMCVEN